jgi:hypothetical protein
MRVRLDECLPRRLKDDLIGHDSVTVPEAGWTGKRNGELIQLAEGRYDVFLTIDKNLPVQQDVGTSTLSVLLVRAPSNRYADLHPLIPHILKTLRTIGQGKLETVGT